MLAVAGCAISPVPLGTDEITSATQDRLARVTIDQEPISGRIDLYEAMARALKYNLDHGVEEMQAALRLAELDLSHWNLLPQATAGWGYQARDNDSGGISIGIIDRTPSLRPSTSQERRFDTRDIVFSWNILDFGLSYIRARQAADKALIAEETRRKVIQRVIEDVRTAYWRAVSAERLIQKLQALEGRTRTAISDARAVYDSRQTSPITALTYERELVEIKRTLQELNRELSIAKTQLAALMNVVPGTKFKLAIPARHTKAPKLKMGAEEMVYTALNNRSELREVDYQRRINQHEAHAALLELLPGFNVFAGNNYDGNDFLFNNHWVSWGAKASWNVLKVFQYPRKAEVVDAQDRLLDQRGLALSMAIMTQVHVSRARYYHHAKELATASEYLDVQNRLIEQMRAEARGDRISEQTLIREEMNTLVAEVKHDIAFASLQNSYANVFASMGVDPIYADFRPETPVRELASALRAHWFERGDFAQRSKVAAKSD